MAVLLATFTIPAFAVPDNNINGYISIYGVGVTTGSYIDFPNNVNLSYGKNHLIVVNYDSYNYYESYLELSGTFTITLNQNSDLYFAHNGTSGYDVIPQTGIEQYRDTSKDFTESKQIITSGYSCAYDGDEDEVSLSSYTPPSSARYTVKYKCYSNVPSGTYNIEYQYYHGNDTGDFTGNFVLGLFAVSNSTTPDVPDNPGDTSTSIIDGFRDGTYSFDTALDMLISNMESVVNSPALTDYKNFYVNYTSAMIDILEKESDIIYNASVSDFNDAGEVVIDSFIDSNTQDVSSYISSLTSLFTSALENASSAEQGNFLSSVFQNLLAKLELAYEMSLYDVVTDDEVEENAQDKAYLKDLFSDEDEALEMFDRAQYESMLDFNEWISELSNYQQYRNIFEWFFSSSGELRLFIIIPFAFVLVSLLLGTTTVVISHHDFKVRREREYVQQDQDNLHSGRG